MRGLGGEVGKKVLKLMVKYYQVSPAKMLRLDRSLKRGSLYVVLKRLTSKGILRKYTDLSWNGRGPKPTYYSLTYNGGKVITAINNIERILAEAKKSREKV